MIKSKFNNKLVWIAGFTASIGYLICTTISFFLYPGNYFPFKNWLSDLGNPLASPTGSWIYNLGCIIAAISLIFFSIGLRIWDDGNKRRKLLLLIAQVTNIISAVALIITAIFPLGSHTQIHSISGKIHIIFMGFFLTFSATILLKFPNITKWIPAYGFASALVNFIYGAILYRVFIAEWIAIGMYIFYVVILSIISLKNNSLKSKNNLLIEEKLFQIN